VAWQWVAAELFTGRVIADLPSFDPQWPLKRTVSTATNATGTLHLAGAPENWEQAVRDGASLLACYDDADDSRPVAWCGYVPTTGELEVASDDVPVTMATFEAVLDRVFVGDVTYTTADHRDDIIAGLVTTWFPTCGIAYLQLDYQVGGGPTPPVMDNPPTSIPTAAIIMQNTDNASLLQRMQQVFSQLGGEFTVEWAFSADQEYLVPTLRFGDRIGRGAVAGSDPAVTFELPGSLLNLRQLRDYSAGAGANKIVPYSSGQGTSTPFGMPVFLPTEGRPVFEYRYQPATNISPAGLAPVRAAGGEDPRARATAGDAGRVSRAHEGPPARRRLGPRRRHRVRRQLAVHERLQPGGRDPGLPARDHRDRAGHRIRADRHHGQSCPGGRRALPGGRMIGTASLMPDDGDDWLGRELKKLREEIAELRTARSLENAFIGRGGITVGEDGALTVKDSDGHVVAIIGALPAAYNRSDGSRQPGMAVYREDGTLAAFLGDFNATTPPYKQAWQVTDRAGNIVMADDTNGGKGLAAPWVGGGVVLADTNVVRWPQTTSASFIDVASGWYRVQNPRLSWDIAAVCDAATAGEIRLLVGGVQVSTTQTVGTSFVDWFASNVALPAGTAIGAIVSVELQARRTSGAGSIYATAQRFEGDQSP
jgi:hypothetical protein